MGIPLLCRGELHFLERVTGNASSGPKLTLVPVSAHLLIACRGREGGISVIPCNRNLLGDEPYLGAQSELQPSQSSSPQAPLRQQQPWEGSVRGCYSKFSELIDQDHILRGPEFQASAPAQKAVYWVFFREKMIFLSVQCHKKSK